MYCRAIFVNPLAIATLALLTLRGASASILWDGDASKGTRVFRNLDIQHGDIAVISDTALGKIFRFHVYNVDDRLNHDRAEGSHAGPLTMANGTTYYFGWKQKYGDPLPTPGSGNWVNVFQWKANPAQAGFNYPIVIRADSNNLRVLKQNPNGSQSVAWALGSLPVNQWVSWVLAIHTASDPSVGYVEIWYNGAHKAKVFMRTFMSGSRVDPKWGCYRTSRIDPDAQTYLWRPRCGTTYDDVAP